MRISKKRLKKIKNKIEEISNGNCEASLVDKTVEDLNNYKKDLEKSFQIIETETEDISLEILTIQELAIKIESHSKLIDDNKYCNSKKASHIKELSQLLNIYQKKLKDKKITESIVTK